MDPDVTVLAVDDQPQNLRLLDAVLSPRGGTVLTASGGDEALKLLAERDVDVVLLDIVMPGSWRSMSTRSGRSSAARRTPSSPVVASTTR